MGSEQRTGQDLIGPLSEAVIKNRPAPTGTGILLDLGTCMHLYHHDEEFVVGNRLRQRLKAEQGWFERLVSHKPTIGTFYEDALRALIAEVLPNGLQVGTGFIYDAITQTSSPQIDLLVYDAAKESPIYRRGEFAVVSPDSVTSIAEVKKTLTLHEVRKVIKSFVNCRLGTHPREAQNCQRLKVFAYRSPVKTSRIVDEVAECLENHAKQFKSQLVSGEEATAAMYGITLPQFYFFDRPDAIFTTLDFGESPFANIVVKDRMLGGEDTLNDFLDAMAVRPDLADRKLQRSLRTHPFCNKTRDVRVGTQIVLVQDVPMVELIDKFPSETEKISNIYVGKYRPYAATVPANLNLEKVTSFDEFLGHVQCWQVSPYGDTAAPSGT